MRFYSQKIICRVIYILVAALTPPILPMSHPKKLKGEFQQAAHPSITLYTSIPYASPSYTTTPYTMSFYNSSSPGKHHLNTPPNVTPQYNTPTHTTSQYKTPPQMTPPANVAPSPNHVHQLRTNDVVDVFNTMQEKKIVRLKEVLKSKEEVIEKLKSEIENLKSDSRIKDEEHSRIRQLWRKEAEDALRTLKTSYEDVLTQKRLIEKQLIVNDQEKEKLRSNNDSIEKELATLNATIANEKRNLQIKEDAQMSSLGNPSEKSNQSEKEMLVADLQQARKDKKAMSESLRIRDETLSKLQNSFSKVEIKLSEEEKKNSSLNEELATLKGFYIIFYAEFV